jgi:Protein of unknown function (DUF3987)
MPTPNSALLEQIDPLPGNNDHQSRSKFSSNRAERGSAQEEDWPDPKPLEDYLFPVVPLERGMMPEVLGAHICDVAYRLQCPLEFVASPAVVMLGSLLGTRVRIRMKQHDPWEESPHLWGGIIGPPGSKKTPAASAALKPLRRLQAEDAAALAGAIASYKAKAENHKHDVAVLRSVINDIQKKRLAGKSTPEDEERENELRMSLAELTDNAPKPPIDRTYYFNDATIEALQDTLNTCLSCILVERDELVGIFRQWEMKGHETDRAFWLDAWGGLNPYNGKRMGRGKFFIPLLCLSLFGAIQPVKLVAYLRDPETNLRHDGAVQRFQVLFYPDPVKNPIDVDQSEDIVAKNRLYEILTKLARADYRDLGATGDEYDKVPHFYFDREAQEAANEGRAAIQKKADNNAEDPAMREHLSKFPRLLGGLATIFHVLELASNGAKSSFIPLRHVEMAMKWCECLESHARRVYALANNPNLNAAMALKEKLTDWRTKPLEDGFTARDVLRRQWSGLETIELVNSALARVEETHWIREMECPTNPVGGRPTIRYQINPKIHRKKKGE